MAAEPNIERALTRYPWYRPPDPVWAPHELLSRLRARLKSIDSRLDVWWNAEWKDDDPERPGRWGVVCFGQQTGWGFVFYVEGVGGSYKHVDETLLNPILAELDRRDHEKHPELVDVAGQQYEEQRAAEKNAAAGRKAILGVAKDQIDRNFGIKQTFGPGKLRSRNHQYDSLVNTEEGRAVLNDRKIEL